MNHPISLILPSLALAGVASAQLPSIPNFGPVSALPAGIVVRPDAPAGAPLVPTAITVRPPVGSPTPLPAGAVERFVPWARSHYPVGPDYSPASLFGSLAGSIEIAAHSTGNAVMPRATADGAIPLGANDRWMGLIVSVDNSATGLPNSPTARRVNAPAGVRNKPGADLISYYFSDSEGIAPSVRGQSFIEQSSESFGLIGSSEKREIHALDFALGAQSEARHADLQQPFQFFPVANEYYFCLTLSSASSLFGTNPGGRFTVLNNANTATIYRTAWDPTLAEWGNVEVYRSETDLHLAPCDDTIDALCVYDLNKIVIYSTQPHVGRSQLMIQAVTAGGMTINKPLKDTNGKNVVRELGLTDGTDPGVTANEVDNVISGCPIEPESGLGAVGQLVGTPFMDLPTLFPGDPLLGLSLTRSSESAAKFLTNFVAEASGWGGATPQTGTIDFYINLNFSDPSSPFILFHRATRQPGQDSVHAELQIPEHTPFGNVVVFAVQGGTSGLPIAVTGMSRISLIN